MNTLIIGHRGFVGSNLSRQLPGATGVGRQEINALAGHTFGDVYCAAPQAKKWWANQNPAKDKLEVDTLIGACKRIVCTGSFILFSTVDVYDPPIAVDELCQPTDKSHPYGRHRFMLEQRIQELFGARAHIIRLPALVGQGLKKNIIYDLLNKNNADQVNPNSTFQWFNLDQVPDIIDRVKSLGDSKILNVVSEPLATRLILDEWFADIKGRLNWDASPISYDVRTIHGQKDIAYLYSAEDALNLHLQPFIEAHRSQQ